MHKKAGTIISLTLIGLAIIILLIANGIAKKKEKKPQVINKPVVVNSETKPVSSKPVISVAPSSTYVPPVVSNNVAPINEFTVIDEKSLTKYVEKEEVGVIANKTVVYMKENNSLNYSVDIIISNTTLKFFLAENNYNNLKIGDKVKVQYKIFENASKIKMHMIKSVTLVK